MSANTDEEFDRLVKKFGEGYGLTSIERGLIINGILKLKAGKPSSELSMCEQSYNNGYFDGYNDRIKDFRRFETRSPGISEVGECDGSACVECATPCEHHLERSR